ncbi:hypothetical protein L195_g060470, partial [Trifolium pratense]
SKTTLNLARLRVAPATFACRADARRKPRKQKKLGAPRHIAGRVAPVTEPTGIAENAIFKEN